MPETLQEIIHNFSPAGFIDFFRLKNRSFRPYAERVPEYNDDRFTDALFLGEIPFNETDKLVVYSFRVNRDLTERSGKKAQYEKGKRILKETQADAGIFIFHDRNGNFRFSLITANYTGTGREFSHFKRYTYFVSPEETNKTFLQQVERADFSSIEKLKEAFSLEKVTKEFYQEISNWYFWALKYVKFPPDAEKEPSGRNIALIRLITRIIFIWFMKQKGIVPDHLFKLSTLKSEILKDLSPDSSTFYKAILQNLFFATLNTKQGERRFRDERRFHRGWNRDFGNQYVYRYHDLFKDPEKMQEYFGEIPFLNGGLFECLDDGRNNIYIDGFTERSEKYQPVVPNFLFFSDETTIDLSRDYGEARYKKARVRGLIDILQSYNFTIDENTPVDEEIALDPELLGKVFENLLASYNPETAMTARKATGSYYTPREIVDYMVKESLKACFKEKIPEIDEDKLDQLFSYDGDENPFGEVTTAGLIEAIHNLRIIDPAVGSGAFPMGVLHALVHILHKLDPHNERWKDQQIRAVEDVADPQLRQELIDKIEESFALNELDYGRKLYLIQNCIYGVDIQPIAIQIAKLRFFISLLVDEKVDKTRPNWGIEPLPNLETKFVAANTLIGLPRPEQLSIKSPEVERLEEELKELRDQYFVTWNTGEKEKLKKKDSEIRNALASELAKSGFGEEATEKIARWNPYNTNSSADWFDPEWMFGVKDGFDIVIGNPPYVRQEKIKHLKPLLKQEDYKTFNSTADLYTYFYERGYQILKERGILCYISSNKWMRARYGENLRRFLKESTEVLTLIDFGGYSVFEQTVDTSIILFQKSEPDESHELRFVNVKNNMASDIIAHIRVNPTTMPQKKLSNNAWTLADKRVLALKEKIEKVGKPLKEWNVKIFRGVLTGFNQAFIIDTETRKKILKNCRSSEERRLTEELIRPVLRGRDIGRYYYRWAGLWLIKIESGWTNRHRKNREPEKFFKSTLPAICEHLISFVHDKGKGKGLLNRDDQGDYWWELRDCVYYDEFEREKIIYPDISEQLTFTFDSQGYFLSNTGYFINSGSKYLLGVLNSSLIDFYYKQISSQLGNEAIRAFTIYLEQLPIPPITPQNKTIAKKIEALVDEILNAKKQNAEVDISTLEQEIDRWVYDLYKLTPEEIEIVGEGDINDEQK